MKNISGNTKVRLTTRIILFFLIFVMILSGLSVLVRPKNNTKESGTFNYQAKGIYSEQENSIDVVAIGASNFWCGFSPMEIWKNRGYTTYNCGTLMQEIWYSYYFLEEIYKTQTPKVVIFDADVLFLEDTSIIDNINACIRETLHWKLPVTEYHNRWKDLSKDDLTMDVSAEADSVMKGFYYSNAVQAYEDREFMDQEFDNEEITFLDKIYLEKIQKLCEEHGTKLVLMEAPAERAWNAKRREKVLDYAKEHEIGFLDCNISDIGIDWDTDSRDGGFHLNYSGAKKFTAYVEEYLVNFCDLKDHRTDPAYQKWNDDLAEYLKQTGGNV